MGNWGRGILGWPYDTFCDSIVVFIIVYLCICQTHTLSAACFLKFLDLVAI
jgi:hypothetical protein